jgi:hypothetical protein
MRRFCSPRTGVLLLILALFATAEHSSLRAEPPDRAPGTDFEPLWPNLETPSYAQPLPAGRYARDAMQRAGCPQRTAWYAMPSVLSHQYSAGYVGGGAVIGGEPRTSEEGVWGLDYDGLLPRRIWLNWYHGRRSQGGTQGYKTDGPKLRH